MLDIRISLCSLHAIRELIPGSRNPGISASLPIPKSRDLGVPIPGFSGLKFAITMLLITLRASEAAAQCIVIAPVSLCVCVFICLWVCYYDNSKLRASILTKLDLQVKVVKISS